MTGDPRSVRLTVIQPDSAPTQLSLPVQTITLGRASDCTVPIRDRFLSRRHAEISYDAGQWLVRDCGSVNGTLLNGIRVSSVAALHPGDRILLGDSEVLFEEPSSQPAPQLVPIDSDSHARSMVIPMREAIDERGRERLGVLASLAVEFIEDRPMTALFDFILARVMELMRPSRVALALLGPDGRTFTDLRLRQWGGGEEGDLAISRTLLAEVIEERNVVSFVDTGGDEKLVRAASIIGQRIRSAVCAPMIIGDSVIGVLYLDYLLNHGTVTPEDLRLVAQVARFAAAKLETTRLREEALAKARIDEELRTAYTIQSRLLPASLPDVGMYRFAGGNKPCRTVSGDYYDVLVRPDGRVYFVIADVSGKGITAALVMSSLATAFNIFARNDPAPADLVRELNLTLTPRTSPSKFATLVAGVLDPESGIIDFANAGHVAPLLLRNGGVELLTATDLVVGLFESATYRNQTVRLERGDALVLFTDGVTEAENEREEQLGLDAVAALVAGYHGHAVDELLSAIDRQVQSFIGASAPNDDVTMLAIGRR